MRQQREEELEALRAAITANLKQFDAREIQIADLKHAAVALIIGPHRENLSEPTFLITRRPQKMSSHAGQWALPGGRLDTDETAFEAAQREVREEIGLDLGETHLIGRLDDYATRSGYVMSPFVFWWDAEEQLHPNPAEVHSVYQFPLTDFDRPPAPEFLAGPDPARPILRLHFGEYNIHAPTGAILYQFWRVGLKGENIRVDNLDQPEFAWR